MKDSLIRIALTILWLAMCTLSCTHKPHHATKSEQEWTSDHQACERWVREGIRDEPDTYDQYDEMRLIKKCMKDKGWQWERTDLFNFKKDDSTE